MRGRRIVVAITGASGVIYGIRLLEVLREERVETILIVSETAKKLIPLETSFRVEDVYGLASQVYENDALTAEVSSGTAEYDGAAVVPCSMKTLGCIAAGISATLITRVAEVCLKEELGVGDEKLDALLTSLENKGLATLYRRKGRIELARATFKGLKAAKVEEYRWFPEWVDTEHMF